MEKPLLHPQAPLMKVWVQLVDSHGASSRGSSAGKLTLADDADVADLRDAIKIKNKDILKGITASQLIVYSTRDNLADFNKSLSPRDPVNVDVEYLIVVPEDSGWLPLL